MTSPVSDLGPFSSRCSQTFALQLPISASRPSPSQEEAGWSLRHCLVSFSLWTPLHARQIPPPSLQPRAWVPSHPKCQWSNTGGSESPSPRRLRGHRPHCWPPAQWPSGCTEPGVRQLVEQLEQGLRGSETEKGGRLRLGRRLLHGQACCEPSPGRSPPPCLWTPGGTGKCPLRGGGGTGAGGAPGVCPRLGPSRGQHLAGLCGGRVSY